MLQSVSGQAEEFRSWVPHTSGSGLQEKLDAGLEVRVELGFRV